MSILLSNSMQPNTRQTREQQRAEDAFQRVQAVVNENQSWIKDYGRQCRRLPTMLLQVGLCQMVGFYQAKGRADATNASRQKEAFLRVLSDLALVMREDTLPESARTNDISRYRAMTLEALKCAHYLKRYVEAFDLGAPDASADGVQP